MRKRPETVTGTTTRFTTPCGTLHVTVNLGEDGLPVEVWARMGKAGTCMATMLDSICLAINYALQANGSDRITKLVRKLKGTTCHAALPEVKSCVDAIAQALARVLPTASEEPTAKR